MKRLLLIFISFLFYINCTAQEIPIQLYKDTNKDWVKDDRSLSIDPTATYNENSIFICPNMPIENIQITIKNECGNTIYSIMATRSSKHYVFELLDTQKGKYTLELAIGEDTFYGYFEFMTDATKRTYQVYLR